LVTIYGYWLLTIDYWLLVMAIGQTRV
jgi:hypothetical protein